MECEPTYAAFVMDELESHPRWEAFCEYVGQRHGGVMRSGKFAGRTFIDIMRSEPEYTRFLMEQHSDNERYARFVEFCRSAGLPEGREQPQQRQTRRTTEPRSPRGAAVHDIGNRPPSSGVQGDVTDSSTCESSDSSSDEAVVAERLHLQSCCKKVLRKAKAPLPWNSLVSRAIERLAARSKRRSALLRDKATLKLKLLACLKASWLSKTDATVALRQHNRSSVCLVCMNSSIDTVCIPCGHKATCIRCAERCRGSGCPICRQPIRVYRTFEVA